MNKFNGYTNPDFALAQSLELDNCEFENHAVASPATFAFFFSPIRPKDHLTPWSPPPGPANPRFPGSQGPYLIRVCFQ